MNELIPVTRQCINETETLTCDGRKLHEFLEVGRDYSSWLNQRIEKYGFIEGVDYVLLPNSGEQNGRGGHNRIDHILSIDMAKQLAMVENNDKGLQVRRYFIECERIAKEARKATHECSGVVSALALLLEIPGVSITIKNSSTADTKADTKKSARDEVWNFLKNKGSASNGCIYKYLRRKFTKSETGDALNALQKEGCVVSNTIRGQGRPTTYWSIKAWAESA